MLDKIKDILLYGTAFILGATGMLLLCILDKGV